MKKVSLMILALLMTAPAFAGEVKGNCTVASDSSVKVGTVAGQSAGDTTPVVKPTADAAQ